MGLVRTVSRDFVIQNACYWVDEFHLDGLRLDAVHAVHDASPRHVLAGNCLLRQGRPPARNNYLGGRMRGPMDPFHPADRAGRVGLDAVWSEDFHHTTRVAATGRREGYYSDYLGTPRNFSLCETLISLSGQRIEWQGNPEGAWWDGSRPAGLCFSRIMTRSPINCAVIDCMTRQTPDSSASSRPSCFFPRRLRSCLWGKSSVTSSPFLFFCRFSAG